MALATSSKPKTEEMNTNPLDANLLTEPATNETHKHMTPFLQKVIDKRPGGKFSQAYAMMKMIEDKEKDLPVRDLTRHRLIHRRTSRNITGNEVERDFRYYYETEQLPQYKPPGLPISKQDLMVLFCQDKVYYNRWVEWSKTIPMGDCDNCEDIASLNQTRMECFFTHPTLDNYRTLDFYCNSVEIFFDQRPISERRIAVVAFRKTDFSKKQWQTNESHVENVIRMISTHMPCAFSNIIVITMTPSMPKQEAEMLTIYEREFLASHLNKLIELIAPTVIFSCLGSKIVMTNNNEYGVFMPRESQRTDGIRRFSGYEPRKLKSGTDVTVNLRYWNDVPVYRVPYLPNFMEDDGQKKFIEMLMQSCRELVEMGLIEVESP